MNELPAVVPVVPLPTTSRLLLALAVGPFVGLEREHRGKEAGLRTFGFAALLGSLGGLLGEPYALLCLGFLGVLIAFLNLQALRANQGAELTTSAALLVTGLCSLSEVDLTRPQLAALDAQPGQRLFARLAHIVAFPPPAAPRS